MKTITIALEDKEHELLSKKKGKHNTWRSALLFGCHKLEEARGEND